MSIKKRLFFVMFAIFFVFLVSSVISFILVTKQKNDGFVINVAGRQRMLIQKMSKEILYLKYIVDTKRNLDDLPKIEKDVDNSVKVFDMTISALINSGKVPLTLDANGPKRFIPSVKSYAGPQLKKVKSMWDQLKEHIEKIKKYHSDSSLEYILNNNMSLLREMNNVVVLLQKMADKKVFLQEVATVLALILGLVVIFIAISFLNKTIVEPIVSLATFARDVSMEFSSDEVLDLTEGGKDNNEITLLDRHLHEMVDKLRQEIDKSKEASLTSEQMAQEAEEARKRAEEAMKKAKDNEERLLRAAQEINEDAEKIFSLSEELSRQADEVAEGADLQKQRVVETATAMEQMNATVLEVAKNAASAAENAQDAKERAENGAEVVDRAVSAINEINELTERLKENMEVLNNKANNISTVITVISDIADQTNLLALNAAIEAARAGEAGRGFAVVADEIRKLAEKTMNATKEVGNAITEIQEEVRKDVEEMENVATSVEKGTALARESRGALEEIVKLVVSISDQISAIAAASEEQSAASDEINRSISEISDVSDATVNNIENIRTSIQDLVELAGALKKLMEETVSNVT